LPQKSDIAANESRLSELDSGGLRVHTEQQRQRGDEVELEEHGADRLAKQQSKTADETVEVAYIQPV
jgi:hypothetical protein